MDPYDSDPRRVAAATCGRCGQPARAGTGSRSICTDCGNEWQVEPSAFPLQPRPPAGRADFAGVATGPQHAHPDPPLDARQLDDLAERDDLSAAVLSGERIRAYLDGPMTEAERARARRAVDELDVDRWRR